MRQGTANTILEPLMCQEIGEHRITGALLFIRSRLAPYKRIRRIEFSDLPKTISGKIRRAQLRNLESHPNQARRPDEYWEEDFPDL